MIGWIDAGAGASGDMLLGALVGAGVPLGVIAEAVQHVAPTVSLTQEPTKRGGLAATRVVVGDTGSEEHRRWSDIASLLDESGIHEDVRSLAHDVFQRLAEAEARVHGIGIEEVHFHEVGALDAIADIVGVCAGIVHLGLDRIVVSPVAVGSGSVTAEHGRLPVPVPAVAELLRGVPSMGGPAQMESCTPTGAALLVTLADEFAAQPAMAVESIGVGAGAADPAGHANVTRLLIGSASLVAAESAGPVLLETNIDDLDPRLWPVVIEALLDAGAADAWLTPILMKKGRPAHTLHVLVSGERLDGVRREVYRQTTTIGMRITHIDKHSLDRELIGVVVDGQSIDVKVASLDGEVLNVQPEFEHVRRAAQALGRSTKEVMAQAIAAASSSDATKD